MKLKLTMLFMAGFAATSFAQTPSSIERDYDAVANRIIAAATSDSFAYNRLAEMTDRFGNRLSGSDALERALDWVLAQMKQDGFANVHGEPAMVPHWVRGAESLDMLSPRAAPIKMIGLGMSVATPPDGITGEVVVVNDFDDLARHAADVKGRIVLFDVPFTNYGETVRYRSQGPSAAAKLGATACLIRSVSSYSMRNPHTGSLNYDTTVVRIPAAAVSVEDALMLHRMQNRGQKIVVRLKMSAQQLPDVQSRNVMGELLGREKPDEVVILGGHMDSWDVGQGAMDDGGGVVAAWEAVRLLKKLGLQPRRTIRVVGWTNEENGTRGARAYAAAHGAEADKHALAIESDGGVFKPLGFGFTGSDSAFVVIQRVGHLLEKIGAGQIIKGGDGADIDPMVRLGVPGLGLNVAGDKYFWFHHSEADTMDKLDPREINLCVATMAIMAYVIADLPESLPHQRPQ